MDLTQNLSIQNMIRGMLNEAKEKIAMEESKHQKIESKERKALSSVKSGVEKLDKLESEEKEQMKTASLEIEKLANAIDYINENFESLMPKGLLSRTLDKMAFEVASGPGALSVTQTRGGSMHLKQTPAVTPDPSKSTAHTALDTHMGGSHTQVDNTHDEKPGDGSYDNHHKMPLQNPPHKTKTACYPGCTEKHEHSYDKEDKKKELAKMARNMILSKLAGEDVMKAKISAERGPHAVGKGPSSVKTWDVTQTISAPESGGGHLRKLIESNRAAFDYDKKQAKRGLVREQSGQVWDEPAFHDGRLQDTFVHNETAKTQGEGGAVKTAETEVERAERYGSTGGKIGAGLALGAGANYGLGYGAGRLVHRVAHGEAHPNVKVASDGSATQLLAKIASMGCVCNDGECPYCTMVGNLKKIAGLEAMQPSAAGPPADGSQVASADPAMMGQAPGRPEGCTCNGQPPLCKVCKLQMMLENMKQQQAAMPPQMGAAPAGPAGAQQMPQQMGGA